MINGISFEVFLWRNNSIGSRLTEDLVIGESRQSQCTQKYFPKSGESWNKIKIKNKNT
jgi:hypothetical protein